MVAWDAHVTLEQVHRVVAQWQYDRDTPKHFLRDYRRWFGGNPPNGMREICTPFMGG